MLVNCFGALVLSLYYLISTETLITDNIYNVFKLVLFLNEFLPSHFFLQELNPLLNQAMYVQLNVLNNFNLTSLGID